MKNILEKKVKGSKGVDNIRSIIRTLDLFNVTVQTRAGKSSLILLMSIVQMATLTLYGMTIFEYKAGSEVLPTWGLIILGLFIAFCVEVGVYISAQNGWLDYSKKLYMISALLAFLGFGYVILIQTFIDPFSRTLVESKMIDGIKQASYYEWHMDVHMFIKGLIILIGQVLLAWLPSYSIHYVSIKIYNEYGAMKSFKEVVSSIETSFINDLAESLKPSKKLEVSHKNFLPKKKTGTGGG